MPHDHDRHYRYLFSHPGFVQRLLETFVEETFVADLDFSTLRHLEGRFVDQAFAGREADAVWSVQFRERPWTAPRSFQEAVEPSIPAEYIPAFRYYAIILRDFDPTRLARMRGAVAAVFYAERLDREEVFAHLDTIVDIMKEEEPELKDMFRNWLAHATGVSAAPQTSDRTGRTPEEEKRMLSSTVDAYERKLKEAARKEGREEGLERGLEQGRHAALLETARKMLDSGSTVEYVVAVTELPREEVEKLAGEIRNHEGRDTEDE